jgi:hypothetical protein
MRNGTSDLVAAVAATALAAVVVSTTILVTVAEIAGSKTNKEPKLKQGRIRLSLVFDLLEKAKATF